MSRFVCIEERGGRQKLAQTFDERAFARGNSTGNPNCRHKQLSAVEAAVSAAKFKKEKSARVKTWQLLLVAVIDRNRHQPVPFTPARNFPLYWLFFATFPAGFAISS